MGRLTMAKYIDAEKLIALLEQRKKQLSQWTDKKYANQRIDEIDCILDVDIDSLQQEQPKVDLEKEIEQYTEETIHLPITHKRTPMDIMESDWVRCAHHFYKLGKNSK